MTSCSTITSAISQEPHWASAFNSDSSVNYSIEEVLTVLVRGTLSNHQILNQLTTSLTSLSERVDTLISTQTRRNIKEMWERINRGYDYRDRGDFERAFEEFDWAVTLMPNHPAALLGRGKAQRDLGQDDGALSDLSEALKHNPDDVDILSERGDLYRTLDELDLAVVDLSRALNMDPKHASALATRGEVFRLQKALENALTDLAEALRIRPRYRFAQIARAEVYSAMGETEKALDDLDQVLKIGDARDLDDSHAYALWVRAQVLASAGKWEAAIKDIEQAIVYNQSSKERYTELLNDIRAQQEQENRERQSIVSPPRTEGGDSQPLQGGVLQEVQNGTSVPPADLSQPREVVVEPSQQETSAPSGKRDREEEGADLHALASLAIDGAKKAKTQQGKLLRSGKQL